VTLRLSFGSRWIEIYLFSALMLGSRLLVQIQYGNNSTVNLIILRRESDGRLLFKWRKNKARFLKWRLFP
jgi:hypothetical protein